jgi:Stage II sporulation protein E (SpoIIE)
VVLFSAPQETMHKLFNLAGRGESAFQPTSAALSELDGARLAASSFGRGTIDDCLWLRVSPTRILFALLEAGGRGEQRQELLQTAGAAIRLAAPDLLHGDETNEADAMVEICSRLNRALLQTSRRIISCTAFAGCYNERLGTVCYFSAGHIPALLGHDSTITELQATGLPLGLFSHSTPDAPTTALPHGATLLVASRRLIHAKRRGSQFGFGRLRESLQGGSTRDAEDICGTVSCQLREFMGNQRLHEMSVLALTRTQMAAAAAG